MSCDISESIQHFDFNVFCTILRKLQRMDRLFGKRKTPEEMLRQNQRALNKVKGFIIVRNTVDLLLVIRSSGSWTGRGLLLSDRRRSSLRT